MKQTTLLLLAAGTLAFSSCREEESNMGHIEAMKDSIFAAYPTVAATTIDVQESRILIVALGDKQLYNAPDAERQREAYELGLMAMRIFGKNNNLEHGRLVVTKDERNISLKPIDGKNIDINIDSIRIELAKKSDKAGHVPGI